MWTTQTSSEREILFEHRLSESWDEKYRKRASARRDHVQLRNFMQQQALDFACVGVASYLLPFVRTVHEQRRDHTKVASQGRFLSLDNTYMYFLILDGFSKDDTYGQRAFKP